MRLRKMFPVMTLLLAVMVLIAGCSKKDDEPKQPTVPSTSPGNQVTGVPRNAAIEITFSGAMDPSTINESTFIVTQGSTVVPGVVTYSGTTATFTPTQPLAAGTAYTATVTTGAKNVAGLPLAENKVWSFTTGGTTSATLATVDLGTAANFVILAKTKISNVPTSAITGDLGLSPAATSFFTGFTKTDATGYSTATEVTGKLYGADMASPTPYNLTTAVNNMITAYNDAAGRPSPDFSELALGNIGGKTLLPGLYKWTTAVTVATDVTLNGSATDIWIFQISQNLTVSADKKIMLTGGALPQNIFWQVAGQATFGTTSHFEGNVIAMTGITFQTNASLKGRALAQTAVILDKNVIVKP